MAEHSKTLFSKTINAKTKSYFVDVKVNAAGDRFLQLTESRRAKNGEGFDRSPFMIYHKHAPEFFQALQEAEHLLIEHGEGAAL